MELSVHMVFSGEGLNARRWAICFLARSRLHDPKGTTRVRKRACVLSRERGRPKSAETATRTARHIPSKDGSNQGEVKVIGAPCRTARHKRNPANNSSTMVPT